MKRTPQCLLHNDTFVSAEDNVTLADTLPGISSYNHEDRMIGICPRGASISKRLWIKPCRWYVSVRLAFSKHTKQSNLAAH